MKANKKAGLLALFAVAVMAIASFTVLLDSNDSDAELGNVDVSDLGQLKAALEGDTPVCVNITADITTDYTDAKELTVKEGFVLNINQGCTLTINESTDILNYGTVCNRENLVIMDFAAFNNFGMLRNYGVISVDDMGFLVNYGDPVFQKTGIIESPKDAINGVIYVDLTEPMTVTSRGTNTHDLVYNGVNYETVWLHAKTATPALGTYKFALGGPADNYYMIFTDDDYNFKYCVLAAADLTVVAPSSMAIGQTDDDDINEDMLVPVAAGIMVLAGLIILTTMFARRH